MIKWVDLDEMDAEVVVGNVEIVSEFDNKVAVAVVVIVVVVVVVVVVVDGEVADAEADWDEDKRTVDVDGVVEIFVVGVVAIVAVDDDVVSVVVVGVMFVVDVAACVVSENLVIASVVDVSSTVDDVDIVDVVLFS